jgi:glyceraldehyde-3-phosphate dehydrogenase/erythrose-4-phosphate dehydrogenase
MAIRIGINGFGRIGRLVFRSAMKQNDVTIVGINDLLDVNHLAYLLKYDSVHGKYDGTVEVEGNNLVVDGQTEFLPPYKKRNFTSMEEQKKWSFQLLRLMLLCL